MSYCNQYKHNCREVIVNDGTSFKMRKQLPRVTRRFKPVAFVGSRLDKWFYHSFRPFIELWLRRITLGGVASVFVYLAFMALVTAIEHRKEPHVIYETEAMVIDTTHMSIAELKKRTTERLASECETKGVDEPDAAIILDTNHQMSIGKYMWQIKSVQFYAEKLYGEQLSRKEAILTALGEGAIDINEMTQRVLFEVENGHREWFNCANALGLEREIEIINSL